MNSQGFASQSAPSSKKGGGILHPKDVNKENVPAVFGAENQPHHRQHPSRDPLQSIGGELLNGEDSAATKSTGSATDRVGGLKGGSEFAVANPVMKVSVDPPGVMGTNLPWMQHDNTGVNPYVGGNPNFQFPPMNHWGYHHQQQQGHVPNPSQQQQQHWTIPFLAPIAASVRHPFANFMGNNWAPPNNAHTQNPYWPHQQYHDPEQTTSIPMEAEATKTETGCSTAMDVVETTEMSKKKKAASKSKAKTQCPSVDLPSTFAPMHVIQKVKARNEAAGVVSTIQVRANETSSTKRVTRSVAKALKNANEVVACQALSPQKANVVGDIDSSTSPQILTVLGKRVTMIDPVRKVFVIDLLSQQTCDEIRTLADDHTRMIHESGSDAETWRTLYTYTKMDLPVIEVENMRAKYTDKILHDVKKIVGEIFGEKKEAMKLRPRSWKEPHLLLYQKLDDKPDHTGIEMHYDGCDVTCEYCVDAIVVVNMLGVCLLLYSLDLSSTSQRRASNAH